MSGRNASIVIATAFALCLVLAGCGGGSTSSSAASSAASTGASASSSAVASSASTAVASSGAASSGDKHASYFVGKWDLYETDEHPHEQIAQTMELYATDEQIRAQTNKAYGRASDDVIDFSMRFAADGTGTWDTGTEVVSFTWEAPNEGAVTFTSFSGKETALHIPVTDGKITVNGDTFVKAE